jgi:hypothetical protein
MSKGMSVTRIGGSPALVVGGQPAAWFENWILNDPRHLMIIAPRQSGKNALAERWRAAQERA